MATPTLNTDQPVDSDAPQVTVVTDAPPGTYRVRLVVVDELGLESAPVEQTIVVRQGQAIPDGPPNRLGPSARPKPSARADSEKLPKPPKKPA